MVVWNRWLPVFTLAFATLGAASCTERVMPVTGSALLHDVSEPLRDILVANGILNSDYTPNEATAARLGWKLADLADPDIDPEHKLWAKTILEDTTNAAQTAVAGVGR